MKNILDIIEDSVFLNKLYPNGVDKLSIHKVDFININYGSSHIYLYTKQKPSINISKYGEWNVDYDTIVIELSCDILCIKINNAQDNISNNEFKIKEISPNKYEIEQQWDNGFISLIVNGKLIFQKISAYYENKTKL